MRLRGAALLVAALCGACPPSVLGDEGGTARRSIPLRELGLTAHAQHRWRGTSLTLRFRTRVDRTVTAARLRLGFGTVPPSLAGTGSLAVSVNGVPVGVISAAELRAGGERELPIDARLFAVSNDLGFALGIAPAPPCVGAGTWELLRAGTLEVEEAVVDGPADLAALPLPFLDPTVASPAAIPFAFAVPPRAGALEAAFHLAGWFALEGDAPTSFPVSIGRVPETSAVVVATRTELDRLGLPSGGPPLRMIDRPGGAPLLIVTAARDEDLARTAALLPKRPREAGGAEARSSSLRGRPLGPGRVVTLGELLSPNERVVGSDREIRIPFRAQPGLFFWPRAGMEVLLSWEQSLAPDALQPRLDVSLNGRFVTMLQRAGGPRALGGKELRFILPQAFLAAQNELVISSQRDDGDGACPPAHSDDYTTVSARSTLDLRGASEFADLPDLALLGASGFPFTRASALGQTVVVVPEAASAPTVSSLLSVAAHFARTGGAVATGARFVDARAIEPGLDADLIVVGTAAHQPLLQRLREAAPVLPSGAAIVARPPHGIELLRRTRFPNEVADALLPARARGARVGVVESFESPLHAGRSVLLLTAVEEEALPDLVAVVASPALSPRSDLVLVVGGEVRALSSGERYGVGRLGPIDRSLWYFSLHWYLLVLLLAVGSAWLARSVLRAAAGRAKRRLSVGLGLAAAMALGAPSRADESPAAGLEAKASFLERQGRGDKAAEVWEQLVRYDPSSVRYRDALAHCRAELNRAPDPERDRALAAARKLAADGKYAEAVTAYRKLFSGAPPDALALEFYQTLAGSAEGRPAAVAGLARLEGSSPAHRLAYARVLSFDEATRRAGLARLASLDERAGGDETRAAWRQALLWLDAHGSDRRLYDRYLERHGDDREVVGKRAAIGRGARYAGALGKAWAALHEGALDEAASNFERILAASPRRLDALAGLGWVRLAQKRYLDARALERRAREVAPRRRSAWEEPLAESELWIALGEAEEAEQRGEHGAAETKLRALLDGRPRDRAFAVLRLADLLLRLGGRAAEVERLLAEPASRRETELEAGPRRIEALLALGRQDEAARLERRLLDGGYPEERRSALRIDLLRARSRAASARGDDERAAALLGEALALAPSDRALALELVYADLARDATGAARLRAEKLLVGHAGEPEVVAAAAFAENADGAGAAARRTLALVDEGRLPAAARALGERLSFEERVAGALERRPGESHSGPRRRLEELEAAAGEEPEPRALVAAAYLKHGDRETALALARKILGADPPRGVRLRLAPILYAAGPPEEPSLTRLLDRLDAEQRVSRRERASIVALRTAVLGRAADADRRAGDLERAFLRLEPALRRSPEDPVLLDALGRLELAGGAPGKARRIFQRLLAVDPKNLSLCEEAAEAARADGDEDGARDLAEKALSLHPNDARAYLLAGRLAVARGDDPAGAHLFEVGLEKARRDDEARAEELDADAAAERALLDDARGRHLGEPAGDDEEGGGLPGPKLKGELDRVDARYAPSLRGGLVFRFRSGEPGLASLFEVDLPITVRLSPRRYGNFTLFAVPVYLTARQTDLSVPNTAEGFATDGIYSPATLALPLSNDSWGVALSLRYEYRGLLVEAGATPLGFHVADPIGQLGWSHAFGPWSIGLRGFRAPVTDSVLSYAGMEDPRTGAVWGGVRREGGEVDGGFDDGRFGVRAAASFAAFTGEHVETNYGGQYGLGGYWRFLHRRQQEMRIGLDLFAMHDAKNLRYFTYGQGGYFSPQFFLYAGVPLSWERSAAEWSFRLGGELGVNYFFEDATPFFPLDPSLQALRDAAPLSGEAIPGGRFASMERVGPYGKLHASFERELGRWCFLDGSLDAEAGPAFTQVFFAIGVRKDVR